MGDTNYPVFSQKLLHSIRSLRDRTIDVLERVVRGKDDGKIHNNAEKPKKKQAHTTADLESKNTVECELAHIGMDEGL